MADFNEFEVKIESTGFLVEEANLSVSLRPNADHIMEFLSELSVKPNNQPKQSFALFGKSGRDSKGAVIYEGQVMP